MPLLYNLLQTLLMRCVPMQRVVVRRLFVQLMVVLRLLVQHRIFVQRNLLVQRRLLVHGVVVPCMVVPCVVVPCKAAQKGYYKERNSCKQQQSLPGGPSESILV